MLAYVHTHMQACQYLITIKNAEGFMFYKRKYGRLDRIRKKPQEIVTIETDVQKGT